MRVWDRPVAQTSTETNVPITGQHSGINSGFPIKTGTGLNHKKHKNAMVPGLLA